MAAFRSPKSGATLEIELDGLLAELCVQLGFCNGITGAQLVAGRERLTADDFACAVLISEKMTPDYEKRWRREIAGRFESVFGASAEISTPSPE